MWFSSITAPSAPARDRSSRPTSAGSWSLSASPSSSFGRQSDRITCAVPRDGAGAQNWAPQPDNIVGATSTPPRGSTSSPSRSTSSPATRSLTTDHEYSALEKTWTYVARRTGRASSRSSEFRCRWSREAAFTDAILAEHSRSRPACCSSATSHRRRRSCFRSRRSMAAGPGARHLHGHRWRPHTRSHPSQPRCNLAPISTPATATNG